MKVLIDADGCPVTEIALRICREFSVSCLILCDTAHEFHLEGAETMVVDKGADSVDFAIVRRLLPGDLVITQDYGLASMCLTMHARAFHQNGWEYTAQNIDELLLQRHAAHKLRAAGAHLRGPAKRNRNQNKEFALFFRQLLQTTVQG